MLRLYFACTCLLRNPEFVTVYFSFTLKWAIIRWENQSAINCKWLNRLYRYTIKRLMVRGEE
jgi:hypothetical protein